MNGVLENPGYGLLGNPGFAQGDSGVVKERGTLSETTAPPSNGHQDHSDSIAKLVEALAKAQLEFQPILKESENPAFARGNQKAKYASLDAVINATRPALAKHGLVLFQLPKVDYDAKRLTLVSKLAHSSGEWIENSFVLPAINQQGFTAHSVGSALTYARRYAWQAVTGCVAEEDDDGNAAADQGSREAAQSVAKHKLEENGVVPSLFYSWDNETQTAIIVGSASLKEANRDVIAHLWDVSQGQLVANSEQLEALKYELDRRGVPFSAVKSGTAIKKTPASTKNGELEQVLEESVKRAKAKNAQQV